MDEKRKSAYRYLLYWAMVHARQLRGEKPTYSKEAVAVLADWLHNLAYFSSAEFKGFDEEWFWRDGKYLSSHFPYVYQQYKEFFTSHLNGTSVHS